MNIIVDVKINFVFGEIINYLVIIKKGNVGRIGCNYLWEIIIDLWDYLVSDSFI